MDFAILHRPRMSGHGFRAELVAGASPAALEAAGCWAAFVVAGVDPAVALAVFRHESGLGRAGRARPNRSWGNLRDPQHDPFPYPVDAAGFRRYPSWTAGAQDTARLLRLYGLNLIRPGHVTSTTQTFPFTWAPSSDGNAPDAYGDAVTADVAHLAHRWPPIVPPAPAPRVYVVRAGDTLDAIARSHHVVGGWRELYRLNRARIGPNPNLIHPGLTLRLP